MHGFEGSFETDGYYWGKANFRSKWPVDITQQDSSHAGNSAWNPRPTLKPCLVSHSTLPMLWGPAWSKQEFKEKPENACSSAHGDLRGKEQQGYLGAAPVGYSCCKGWKFPLSIQALLESAQPVERVTTAPCTSSRAQHRLQKRKSTLNLVYFYYIYIRANIWKC